MKRKSIAAWILSIASLTFLVGGASTCVGPAEFTSGLPEDKTTAHDAKLVGWWYGVQEQDTDTETAGSPAILLAFILYEEQLYVYLEYTHRATVTRQPSCFLGVAVPKKIGETNYYDITWPPPDEADNCEFYHPDYVEPGHIIVKTGLDARERLYVRFVSNAELLRLRERGQLEARVVTTGEVKLVEEYLLVKISSEDLAALLLSKPDELFADPVGPFYRLDTGVTPLSRIQNFSGGFSSGRRSNDEFSWWCRGPPECE